MAAFVVFLIIVVAIIAILRSKRKQKASTATQTLIKPVGTEAPKITTGDFSDAYSQEVERTGMQVLETTHIIATSKALDTVQGRYTFLLQVLTKLKIAAGQQRYELHIQRAIDNYKSTYYSTVPQDFQLAIVVKPNEFDLPEFYCKSLAMSFKRFFDDQIEAIKLLKKDDAKKRRLDKILETLQATKDELRDKCSTASSYGTIVEALSKVEESLARGQTTSGETSLLGATEVRSKVSSTTSISRKANAGKDQEVILNAKTRFPLTLVNADKPLAQRIQKILDDGDTWEGEKRNLITPLFAEFNLAVKEIDAYKKKYSKVYNDKLEALKSGSTEWQNAGALDQEDMLADYREIALKEIYEKANCDLVTLFENEPDDVTVDDDLIKEYGFDTFETYLRYADNLTKVRVVPNDNYNREKFVRLVEQGLAIRGSAIPIGEILASLSLKQLNEIAVHPEKEFKRKNAAVDYILAQEGAEERISAKVALLELFKLQSLPEKYSSIDLNAIAMSWKYTSTVVDLFVQTYTNAAETSLRLRENESAKTYRVDNYLDEGAICPKAKEYLNKSFSKSQIPSIPCHVGCNCVLRPSYREA